MLFDKHRNNTVIIDNIRKKRNPLGLVNDKLIFRVEFIIYIGSLNLINVGRSPLAVCLYIQSSTYISCTGKQYLAYFLASMSKEETTVQKKFSKYIWYSVNVLRVCPNKAYSSLWFFTILLFVFHWITE